MTSLDGYLDIEERESRQVHRGTFIRLAKIIAAHSKFLAVGVFLILVGTSATLLEPRLIGYAIDDALMPKDWKRLRDFTILLLLVESIRVSAMIAHGYLFELLGQRVMQRMRIRIFSHLQTLPVSTFDRNPVGRLVTRVTNDISALSEMFSAGFVTMIGNLLVVVGIVLWLLLENLKLGLIAIAVFPALIVASVYFSARLRVAYRNARSKLSALNAFLAENILGMRVVHLFNRQKLHLERFLHLNQWYADAQIGSVRLFAFFQPTITLCAGASVALVIVFGGKMASAGELKLGVLVAFFTYVLSLFQPMREIADKWNVFLSGLASAERIFSVLDWKPELEERELSQAARPLSELRGHIVFENVWFAYQGEHWVLKDFSLEIKPGTRVGIVGHTGAGKTTLISLLMRFYEPQKGRIFIDGKDLREYDKRALRASIGIVQQDVFLFSGSISENINLWRAPDPNIKASVDQALALLGSSGLLQERGANLSMGERQVLAFARALSAQPLIWILDEATANVDSESERRLGELLDKSASGRTTLLIAHRLSTVRSADLIIVLHKGLLVERGNHEELMRIRGLYFRLYRYQSALQHSMVSNPVQPYSGQ